MSLALRATLLALTLAVEKFLLNFLVDFPAAQRATGFGATVRVWQHWGFRFAVTCAAALALFAVARGGARWQQLSRSANGIAVRWGWLLLHVATLLGLAVLSYYLYGNRGAPLTLPALTTLWLLLALVAVFALASALAPWRLWREAASELGILWAYALVAGLLAASAMQLTQSLWEPAAAVTFQLVHLLLQPLIPTLEADSAQKILATGRFAVQVSDVCSGLEGIGLMLAFSGAWLLLFRHEYRFPRALLLIPLGVVLIYLLNVLRIAALVLIGNAGYPAVAAYGFHSQAGWIAFNGAAGALAYFSRRRAWFSRSTTAVASAVTPDVAVAGPQRAASEGASILRNPTAAFLMPLLALLAAGMLARALSSGFEVHYWLRVVAVLLALAYYWQALPAPGRVTWRGPAVGVVIFMVWLLAAHFLMPRASMPVALAAMPPLQRTLWIGARLAGAMVAVPIAEELAYRGYLMRRLEAADFEAVRFKAVGPLSLVLSAVVFGVGHGPMWLAGIGAGLAYGGLARRSGRLGESMAAHATTNGLLAGYVLLTGAWQLW